MKKKNLFLVVAIILNSNIFLAQQKVIDSLEQQLLNPTNGLSKAEILNELSWYYAFSNMEKGIKTADSAINITLADKDSLQLGVAYERKGFNYEHLGNDSIAIELYTKAEDIYKLINHKRRLAALSFNKANFYLFRSDYQKSLQESQKALEIFEENKDTLRIGRVYNQIALNNLYLGEYTIALRAFQKASLLFEQAKKSEDIFYGEIQGNIGLLYEKLSEYQTALEYQEKALGIHKKNEYELGLSNTYNNIGKLYGLLDQHQKALEMFELSYGIKKKMGNKFRIANALTNIGVTYKDLGQYDKAIDNFIEAKTIYEDLKHETNLADIHINLGELYLNIKQPLRANAHFDSAFVYASNTKDKRAKYLAKKGVALSAFKLGNYRNAYNSLSESVILNDSLVSNDKRDELAQIKAQYQYEKEKAIIKADFDKNKAIDEANIKRQVLIRNTSIGLGLFTIAMLAIGFTLFRRKREAELNAKVATSELQTLRAQMNPHFIFNTLNSINDFILKNKKDDASNYLVRFSTIMRKILDNSREEEIPLNEEIEFLESYLKLEQQRLTDRFVYKIIVEDTLDIEETLVPPSLFQPFIENSIWHGFAEKTENDGQLNIDFKKEQGAIVCTIDDNGVGISKHSKNKEKKSFGTSNAQNRLELLNKLKGTNAKIEIIEKEQGVRVVIRLPLIIDN